MSTFRSVHVVSCHADKKTTAATACPVVDAEWILHAVLTQQLP
jgi:hypothetical protein